MPSTFVTRKLPASVIARLEAVSTVEVYPGPDPIPAPELAARVAGKDALVCMLTERIGHALRALIVEAGDRHTLRLLHLAESLWRTGSDPEPDDLRARADRMQRILRGHEHLMEIAPGRVNAFRAELERHANLRARLGVADRALARPYARGAALRGLLREGAGLAIALPVALWGAAQHALPYLLTQLSVAAARPEPDLLSTWKICAGVLLFPLCWIAEAWVVLRRQGQARAPGEKQGQGLEKPAVGSQSDSSHGVTP